MSEQELSKRIHDLEVHFRGMASRMDELIEDNLRLKMTVRNMANWQLSDPDAPDISATELRDELLKWANRDEG